MTDKELVKLIEDAKNGFTCFKDYYVTCRLASKPKYNRSGEIKEFNFIAHIAPKNKPICGLYTISVYPIKNKISFAASYETELEFPEEVSNYITQKFGFKS